MAINLDSSVSVGRPESFGPSTFDNLGLSIDSGAALRAATPPGPARVLTFTMAEAELAYLNPAIGVQIWNSTNTARVTTHDASFHPYDASWTDPLEELGDAQFKLMNSAADGYAGTYSVMCPLDAYVRFTYNGVPAVVRRVSDYSAVEIANDDSDVEATVFLEDPRQIFTSAKVGRRRGDTSRPYSQLRSFAWHDEVDASSWSAATSLQAVICWFMSAGDSSQPPWLTPWEPPRGWEDFTAHVIYSRPGVWMPVGRSYFRRKITKTGTGLVQLWTAALDRVSIFIDGVKVGDHGGPPPDNGWVDPYIITIELTDGEHEIAWEVEKYSRIYPGPVGTLGDFTQRAMLAWALYNLGEGEQTIINRETNLIAHSDTLTKCLDYPVSQPAPTWGAIFIRLMQEGKNRNCLPAALTWSFDAVYDSNGVAWEQIDERTFRGSDDLWAVMQQAQLDGVDVSMSLEGIEVNAFGGTGMGTTFAVGENSTNSLLKVTRKLRGHQVNRIRVQWSGGVFTTEDAARISAAGRAIEGSLELADARSEVAALRLAQGELSKFASYEEGIEIEVEDTAAAVLSGVAPYIGYRPGDRIPVEASSPIRIKGLTVSEDSEAGDVNVQIDQVTVTQDELDRMIRMLERIAPGTLGGTSDVATPIRWADDGAYSGRLIRTPVSDFTQTELVDEIEDPIRGVSSPINILSPQRVSMVRLTSLGVPTSTISVQLRRNGVGVADLWLATGVQHGIALVWNIIYQRGDALQVALTNKGTGGGYLGVRLVMVPASPAEAIQETQAMPWL